MNYSFEQIAKIINGKILQPREGLISNIITDSRRVYHTEESIFIALRGPNHDGHNYIPDLIKKGVKHFLIEDDYSIKGMDTSSGIIAVPDTLEAFQKMASFHRNSFQGKVLAVTGSNGKTVVKEWLAQILAGISTVTKNPKSYNSQTGVPISILQMEAGNNYHIIEAGISQAGEMRKLETMIRPDEGILTNLGDAHQENFIDHASKLKEKLLLFRNTSVLFFCSENPLVKQGVEKLNRENGKKLVSWSFTKEADLIVEKHNQKNGTTRLNGTYKNKNHKLLIPFSDSASTENIIHIWLFWLYHKLPLIPFQEKLMDLEPIEMRLEQKEGLRGCTLINDFYNADLHSLSIALDLLINQLPQPKKTLILSDLLQTGLEEKKLIERINYLLENKNLFRLILIGPKLHKNSTSFNMRVDSYPDTDSFLAGFSLGDFIEEAILLKGARKFTFEKISRRLEKRIHNTVVEVRMNNLLDNLNHFRSRLGPNKMMMAMVKAFSYGSGTHEIAKFLSHQRVDYLGVAFADEGVYLRQSGIEIPIMVMNPDISNMEVLIDHRLEPEIFSIKTLKVFQQIADRAGLINYPIHIKIDTGMHRLGMQPEEISELLSILNKQKTLKIKSVFSHLSSADSPGNDKQTHIQASVFQDLANKIRMDVNYSFLKHLVNTAGIIRFPEYHFDMVRIGIGLYGIDPTETEILKPVIELKSHISQIHMLEKGETIGYGNSETITTDSRIAVIPIGYADGLDRRLGNGRGHVIINGRMAPTIGKICMDMCMLNISGISCEEGDEVIIIGTGTTLNEMADKLDTIPYEILTRIPQRVKRVYLFE